MHLRHRNESSISHFLPKREKIYSFLCGLGFFWYEQKAESILLTLLYKVNALHTLARNLMQLIAPGSPETGAGAAQTAAPAQTGGAPNAVEELKQYTHCRVENVKCLSDTSMVLLEQIKTIDKRRVKKYMGRLDKEQMRRVDDCIEISLGLQIPECVEAP